MCIYIYSKYIFFGMYNVTCIYVLMADHLVFGNQLIFSSLRKTISTALSIA